jgi:glutamate racemase
MVVGIFDSGIGGLTVYDAIKSHLPDLGLVYFGDNKNTPYGVRDADDIFQCTRDGIQILFDQRGCDLVILACNTASAVALRRIQERSLTPEKRVLGVFVPLIEALTGREWCDNSPPIEVEISHVALFATPASVASRVLQRELAFRAIGMDVEAQACGGVVDAIEEGDYILAEALVTSHVEALLRKMPLPDAAILGCTHYSILKAVFQKALGPNVKNFLSVRTRRPQFRRLPTSSSRQNRQRQRWKDVNNWRLTKSITACDAISKICRIV